MPNVTCSLSTNCAASTHTEILILDDIGYVQQSGDEMEILFTLLSERYECRRVIITLNLYFSQWDQILKDPMTNTAAIDCVVHYSINVEFGKESLATKYNKSPNASNKKPQLDFFSA